MMIRFIFLKLALIGLITILNSCGGGTKIEYREAKSDENLKKEIAVLKEQNIDLNRISSILNEKELENLRLKDEFDVVCGEKECLKNENVEAINKIQELKALNHNLSLDMRDRSIEISRLNNDIFKLKEEQLNNKEISKTTFNNLLEESKKAYMEKLKENSVLIDEIKELKLKLKKKASKISMLDANIRKLKEEQLEGIKTAKEFFFGLDEKMKENDELEEKLKFLTEEGERRINEFIAGHDDVLKSKELEITNLGKKILLLENRLKEYDQKIDSVKPLFEEEKMYHEKLRNEFNDLAETYNALLEKAGNLEDELEIEKDNFDIISQFLLENSLIGSYDDWLKENKEKLGLKNTFEEKTNNDESIIEEEGIDPKKTTFSKRKTMIRMESAKNFNLKEQRKSKRLSMHITKKK